MLIKINYKTNISSTLTLRMTLKTNDFGKTYYDISIGWTLKNQNRSHAF